MPLEFHKPQSARNSWHEFELRCQKPDHRRIGNWMARRVARPLALRITWVLAPTGISAHAMTFLALLTAMGAAAAFAIGTTSSWLAAAVALQFWYLLDHVDGQLARYSRKETLDGAALDYLMHHVVNLLVPLGLGWGLFRQSGSEYWMLVGVMAAVGLLLIGLIHDVRYKAFHKRLKRVCGELRVIGGGGAKPSPQPAIPRHWARFGMWCARKSCEIHVIMNLLTISAVASCLLGDAALLSGKILLATLALLAVGTAAWDLARGLSRESAEQEFAAWFKPDEGSIFTLEDGWWKLLPCDEE